MPLERCGGWLLNRRMRSTGSHSLWRQCGGFRLFLSLPAARLLRRLGLSSGLGIVVDRHEELLERTKRAERLLSLELRLGNRRCVPGGLL